VAGRAGRGERPGEVLVQTASPDHAAIVAATAHDLTSFARQELAERKEAGYPPYTRLATLLVTGTRAEVVEKAAERLAERAREGAGEGIEVLGPAPQPLAKLRGRYRWHVLLKAGTAARIHEAAGRALEWAESKDRPAGVRIQVDVDPTDVL
jgi:primosomal protein N' (replication factor Y)